MSASSLKLSRTTGLACGFTLQENGRAVSAVHNCDKAAGGRFTQGAEVFWFILNHPTLSTADDDRSTRR